MCPNIHRERNRLTIYGLQAKRSSAPAATYLLIRLHQLRSSGKRRMGKEISILLAIIIHSKKILVLMSLFSLHLNGQE